VVRGRLDEIFPMTEGFHFAEREGERAH